MTSAIECAAAPCPAPETGLLRLLALPRLWLLARRQRRHLVELPDYLLADIGLRPEDVQAEVDKPFWRIPQAWRDMSTHG